MEVLQTLFVHTFTDSFWSNKVSQTHFVYICSYFCRFIFEAWKFCKHFLFILLQICFWSKKVLQTLFVQTFAISFWSMKVLQTLFVHTFTDYSEAWKVCRHCFANTSCSIKVLQTLFALKVLQKVLQMTCCQKVLAKDLLQLFNSYIHVKRFL